MDSPKYYKKALLESLPIFAAYFPLGIVWGFLWEQAGFSPIWGIVYSFLVYGGAVQFFALQMLSTGEPILSIVLAVTPICLRNGFYTLALLNRLPKPFFRRLYATFGLVDAPFGLLISQDDAVVKNPTYIFPLLILTHLYWGIGTIVGVYSGGWVPDGIASIDFAVPALIATLAFDQLRKLGSLRPLIVALILAPISYFLFGPYWLFGAIAFATLSLLGGKKNV